MALDRHQKKLIRDFSKRQEFIQLGGVLTDLDGTVIKEKSGESYMPQEVQHGLARMYGASCPVIINTLRFPLSIINNFANKWHRLTQDSIPVVTLNGAQSGYIIKQKEKFTFQETVAFPLTEKRNFPVFCRYQNAVDGKRPRCSSLLLPKRLDKRRGYLDPGQRKSFWPQKNLCQRFKSIWRGCGDPAQKPCR